MRRRAWWLIAAVACAIASTVGACGGDGDSGDSGGEPRVLASPSGLIITVDRVVSAEFPAAFAFDPVDGALWYGELANGRLYRDGAERWDFAVSTGGESGLQSIAFSPNGGVLVAYLSVPRGDPSDGKADGGEGDVSRVVRFDVDRERRLSSPRTLLEVPSMGIHNAGSVGVGPDGALYVNIGDNNDFGRSQELGSPFGKILRVTDEGAPFAGNPFAGRADADARVWASGIRNTSAFTWLPDGRMIGADNGDTSDDEINEIIAGRNYGWPPAPAPRDNAVSPLRVFRETIAPAGITEAPLAWSDDTAVLVCGFVSRKMVLVELTGNAPPVEIIDGCTLRVVRDPSGAVVFSDEHGIWRITSPASE